jgi:hypothetical protein
MADHDMHQYEDADFEREDLGAKPILLTLTGIAIGIVVLYFVVDGIYRVMSHYDETHQTAVSPLKPPVQGDTRVANHQDLEKFPEPRLEKDERKNLKDARVAEEDALYSYGWVDEKAGVVRIPIDRAMELIAQRGLPTRLQTGTTPSSVVNTVKQAAQSDNSGTAKRKK